MESVQYRPTSIGFINLPNPIEPHAHPLNDNPRLEQPRNGGPNQNLFDRFRDPSHAAGDAIEPAAKRQKTGEQTALDLPKLPVKNTAKRMRIPPTLSGLYEPPPDAGILPSISTEQPRALPGRHHGVETEGKSESALVEPQSRSPQTHTAEFKSRRRRSESTAISTRRMRHNKWTEEETASLLKGVAKFGIGNWTKILNCEDFQFNERTALDLKDRFRTCCPEQYKGATDGRPSFDESAKARRGKDNAPIAEQPTRIHPKGPLPERVSTSKLRKLGINEPFTKTSRRSRHSYSDEEDLAILQGFRKHGKSWAAIRQDPSLGLSHRKPTDLRDRFRTRYPDECIRAGMATKKSEPPVAAPTQISKLHVEDESTAQPQYHPTGTSTAPSNELALSGSTSKAFLQAPPFSFDSLFADLPLDPEDYLPHEPITLDREILNWPSTTATNIDSADLGRPSGINPLMTLILPKPVSTKQSHLSTTPQSAHNATHPTSLPSLSTLIPSSSSGPEIEQLELPSLAHLPTIAGL